MTMSLYLQMTMMVVRTRPRRTPNRMLVNRYSSEAVKHTRNTIVNYQNI